MAKKQMTLDEQVAEAKRIEELGAQGIDPSVEGQQEKEVAKEAPKAAEPEKPASTETETAPERPEVPQVVETEVESRSLPVIEGTIFDSGTAFSHIQRVAKVFATSTLVPQHYRGQQGFSNCIIGIQLALRLKLDPFMFLQNSYVIQGKPGIEGKLAIALINARAPIKDFLHYDYKGEGDALECTAWCTHKNGEKIEFSMSIAEAKAWGWYAKTGSMWPKMPKQMLAYRTAIFLIRRHFPEVLLGLDTVEELQELGPEDLQTKITAAEVVNK